MFHHFERDEPRPVDVDDVSKELEAAAVGCAHHKHGFWCAIPSRWRSPISSGLGEGTVNDLVIRPGRRHYSARRRTVAALTAARRRLCRAAGPGASPHARLARQCEE